MEFKLLGPLEVWDDLRGSLLLGSGKQRALLALFLLHCNEVVSSARLIDELWEDHPPDTAANVLQVYIGQLRKLLEPARAQGSASEFILSRPGGYLLRVAPGQLDLERFQELLGRGRASLTSDPATASKTLREALALWRGQPLEDVAFASMQGEAARLEELRFSALEVRIEAELAQGKHTALVGELEALATRYPLREQLRAHWMVALYRSGRQADALSVYRETARFLSDELGIDPGPDLQSLDRAILRHDPLIAAPAIETSPAKVSSDCDPSVEAADPPETKPGLLREERKTITVLLAEVTSFAADTATRDPEDARQLLTPALARLRSEIQRRGGTVRSSIGDAMVGVFGAPTTHEDDPERALRAALAMRDWALDDASIELRIAINTGEALVALGAIADGGDLAVSGEVINTIASLQASASRNGILVGASTFTQTERSFTYRALDPVAVRGRATPIAVWELGGSRARLGADVTRAYLTPLVGRDLERSLLVSAFERVQQQRSCQLITLIGEPGVGKTRLCSELLGYLDQRSGLTRWRQGRSLPYGEPIAFWALGEIVKAECGILESDSPDDAAAKLDAAVPDDEPDRDWIKRRLGPLVGAGGEPAAQEESFTAWRRFLEGLAAERPTVLVFEDLHWADAAMLAFLEHLADWSSEVPLLILCTARPELHEQQPTWAAGLRNAQTVNLGPLTDFETATLLDMLLEEAVLPAATHRALLERAGGNPLYAEEFVRLLGDRNLLGASHDVVDSERLTIEQLLVPDSLQALIAARLDTLSAERKSLLQDAAVMGKVFWAGALVAICERDAREVELALHDLARKELVRSSRTSSMRGQLEYAFWHGLVRDVCYAQIPRSSRVERHRAAAAWIERQAGERVDDLADVLAYHYVEALQLARASGMDDDATIHLEAAARRHLALAGERALPIDVSSAQASFARALEITPAGHPDRADLLERWAEAARQQGRPIGESRAALDEALALHSAAGDAVAQARTLAALTTILSRAGDPRRDAAISEALHILEAMPPGPELVQAHAQLAALRYVESEFTDAILAADRALLLAASLGIPPPPRALGFRGAARAYLGEEHGLDDMRHALSMAIEQGMSRDAAVLHNNLALATWQYRGPAVALKLCNEAIEFSDGRGIAEVGLGVRVMHLTVLAACGRAEAVLSEVEGIVARADRVGDVRSLIEARCVHLDLLLRRGEPADAEAAERMVTLARQSGEPQLMAMAFVAAAELGLIEDHHRTRALLDELVKSRGIRGDAYYAAQLPKLVRCAVAIGDLQLAAALMGAVKPLTPLQHLALTSGEAALSEAHGERVTAARRYAEAVNGWRTFGDAPELASALLGQARCLIGLGDGEARRLLGEALELFEAMGFAPELAGAEALSQSTTPTR